MEKFLSLLLSALLLCCTSVPVDVDTQSTYGTVPQASQGVWTCIDETLRFYEGDYGDIVLPSLVDGEPVTQVGSGLFYGINELTSVVIPEGITALGSDAFYACEQLASVTLPDSLQVIADYAFSFSTLLSEIRIPAAVGYIGSSAFARCDGLTSVIFEGEAPLLGDWVFEEQNNITFSVPDDQLEAYRAVLPQGSVIVGSGKNALPHDYTATELEFDPTTGTITNYAGNRPIVVLPAEINGIPVRAIGESAFADNRTMYRLDIAEGIECIGDNAFYNNWNLVQLTLPSTLRSIGNGAFYQFRGHHIELPEGLESIGDKAFCDSYIWELVIPEGVKHIGDSAFEMCWHLYETRLPSTLESVGDRAFADTNITYIRIDRDDMPAFGADVFAGGTKNVLADVDIAWDASREQLDKAIAIFAEQGCTNATVWRLNPSDVGVAIRVNDAPDVGGEYANGLLMLVNSDYPDLTVFTSTYDDNKRIYGVADSCFEGSTTIRSFYPHHCGWFTTIGNSAFANSSLEYIELFDSITTIGENAFANCVNLKELTIPENVTFIGENAFAGCTGLERVTVLCDPSIIPEGSFMGIENVVLSANASQDAVEEMSRKLNRDWNHPVLRIGEAPRVLETMPNAPTDAACFEFDPEQGAIIAYLGTDIDVVIPREIDGVTVCAIRSNAFEACRDYTGTEIITNQTSWIPLRSVVVPETVTVIEDMAFSYCQQLEYFVCYAPLETTGKATFLNCSWLKDVSYVNGVRKLDNYLFESCASLESVYYGDRLETIGDSCFVDSGIERLVVDARTVNNFAFGRCQALTELHFTDRVKTVACGAVNDCAALSKICIESDNADFLPRDGMASGLSSNVTVCVPQAMSDEQIKQIEKSLCVWSQSPSTITVERSACTRTPAQPCIPDFDNLPESRFVPPEVSTPIIAEPIGAEGAPFFGTWYVAQMIMDDMVFDVADYGMSITFTCNDDGTAVMVSGDEEEVYAWKVADGVMLLDNMTGVIDENGLLRLEEENEGVLLCSREALQARTAEPVGAEGAPFFGTWYVTHMIMDDMVFDVADYDLSIICTFNEDGTALLVNDSGEEETIWWVTDGIMRLDGMTGVIDENGHLRLKEGDGGVLLCSREAPQEKAAEPVGIMGTPFFGTWYATHMVMADYVMELGADSRITLTLNQDGTASLFDGDAQESMLWGIANGQAMVGDMALSLNADGCLVMEQNGAQMIFSRTKPVEAPVITENKRIEYGVKYICKSVDVEGISFDASILGAEYSVTLYENGKAKCVFGGVEMVEMPWTAVENGLDIDYYGILYTIRYTDTGFDLQYAPSMTLHF